MPRPRVFTKMMPNGSKMPAIRVEFKGKYQVDYFSLKKVAEEDFETNQTNLARLILSEWLKDYREKKAAGKRVPLQQMVLILKKGEKAPEKETR